MNRPERGGTRRPGLAWRPVPVPYIIQKRSAPLSNPANLTTLQLAVPGRAPGCGELAWYIALNRRRLPQSKEETIDAYRAKGFELSALVPNNAGTFPILVEIDCVMFRQDALPVTVGSTPLR